MIDIVNFKGEKFSFDQETFRIFKDGTILPRTQAEPIFSSDDVPEFCGILLKDTNSILSLSGKINKISDINSII